MTRTYDGDLELMGLGILAVFTAITLYVGHRISERQKNEWQANIGYNQKMDELGLTDQVFKISNCNYCSDTNFHEGHDENRRTF